MPSRPTAAWTGARETCYESDSVRHRNNFDGIRLLAACAVLVSHQFWIAGLSQPLTFGSMTLGSLAVLVFFAISGYLVAKSWTADPTLWRFAIRRFLRIWPAYIVVVAAAAAWVMTTDPRPLATTAAWMFVYKHVFFQGFDWSFFPTLHDPRLNPPLWTIPYEIGCYVVFAGLAFLLRRWWVATLTVALVVALLWKGFGVGASDPSSMSSNANWLQFGAFFAVGAMYSALPRFLGWKTLVALLGVGALAYVTGSQVVGLVIVIPALVIHIGMQSWPVLRQAGRFGDFSYGVYLWGWPVQQIWASTLGVQVGFWTLLAVSLPSVFSLAALSWHLVEKRALSAKPSSIAAWPRWATLELR